MTPSPPTTPHDITASTATVPAGLEAEYQSRTLELLEGRRALEFALKAGRFGTWSLHLASGVLRSSAIHRTNFGRDADASFSQDESHQAIHPDDQARVTDAIAHTITTGADYDIDYRIFTPAGELRWVTIRGQAAYAADGSPLGLSGVSLDITTRKQAEWRQDFLFRLTETVRGLSNSRAILDAASQAVGHLLSASLVGYGTVHGAADAMRMETGYTDGQPGTPEPAGLIALAAFDALCIEQLRRGLTVIHHEPLDQPLDPQADPSIWRRMGIAALIAVPLARSGHLVATMYVMQVAAREWLPQEIALVEEVAVRTWDAVERASAEEALRAANEDLERKIAAALSERERMEDTLRQSQKMEAVGQLTGGLAHDFNNLLAIITGNLEVLQRRIVRGEMDGIERYIHTGQDAARRAATLTHRLLTFSRRQTLDAKPTDISHLVGDMAELVRRTVGPQITLQVTAAPDLWVTRVDPNQLESALLNLCINARDAMPNGGLLRIASANASLDGAAARERDLPAGDYLVLSVRDTGTGISPETAARVFEPFFTTKPIGMGTGLGLSMVYGFVRQSGGQVQLLSAPGEGTEMRLYFPRFDGEAAAHEAPTAGGEAQTGGGETILIVDDETHVRQLVAEVLGDMGYTTIEAGTGAEALKMLQSGRRVDLLVSDVGLPGGMNGRQLADAARALDASLQVLFITGYAETAVARSGSLEAGMRVLTKPFTMDQLCTEVNAMVAESGASAGTSA